MTLPSQRKELTHSLPEWKILICMPERVPFQIKKTKFRNNISNVCNKKWFDKKCRLKRHSVRKLANQKPRGPLNNDIRNEYHLALKNLQKHVKT
jgi:hypothetical protein